MAQEQETKTIELAGNLAIVVCKENDARLSRESGWWIVRTYNPKNLNWVDHSRPGFGMTYWINIEAARKLGLN